MGIEAIAREMNILRKTVCVHFSRVIEAGHPVDCAALNVSFGDVVRTATAIKQKFDSKIVDSDTISKAWSMDPEKTRLALSLIKLRYGLTGATPEQQSEQRNKFQAAIAKRQVANFAQNRPAFNQPTFNRPVLGQKR